MNQPTAIIQTCTGDLSASKAYYQKLAFTQLSEEPTIFTDGQFLLEINPKNTARTGLKLYQKDWAATIEQLKEITAVFDLAEGYLVSDPNGVKVYLMNGTLQGKYDLKGASTAIPGNFAGLSIEAVDIARTITFWQTLGYKKTMGDIEKGWVAFDNGSGVGISIMKPMVCTHQFFNPGLNFFNGEKNLSIIQKIRDAGIPIAEEVTVFNNEGIVDNVILCDRGGLGFFIFND